MSRYTDPSRESRGTVLVASDSPAFVDIVGEMVTDCGFELATPTEAERPWLSVMRTQPTLVICDCGGPEPHVKRLIAEVAARRLPLLIAGTAQEQDVARTWHLPERAAWLEFPIARNRFHATIDDLLMLGGGLRRQAILHGAGVTIEAAITTGALNETP